MAEKKQLLLHSSLSATSMQSSYDLAVAQMSSLASLPGYNLSLQQHLHQLQASLCAQAMASPIVFPGSQSNPPNGCNF